MSSDSLMFDVDVAALGALPEQIDDVREILRSVEVGAALAGVASAAGTPSVASGIGALEVALRRFVDAGSSALGQDVDRLRSAALAYADTEQSVAGRFSEGTW